MSIYGLGNSEEDKKRMKEVLDFENTVNELLTERLDIENDLYSTFLEQKEGIKDYIKDLENKGEIEREISKLLTKTSNTLQKIYSLNKSDLGSEKALDIFNKEQKRLSTIITLTKNHIETLKTQGKETEKLTEYLYDVETNLHYINEELEKNKIVSQQISKSWSISIFDGVNKVIQSIPVLNKFSKPFEEAAKHMRELKTLKYSAGALGKDKLNELEDILTGKNTNITGSILDRYKIKQHKNWDNFDEDEKYSYFKQNIKSKYSLHQDNISDLKEIASRSNWQDIKSSFSEMSKNMAKTVKAMRFGLFMGFIKQSLDYAHKLDSTSVDIGKSLGYSEEKANLLAKHYRDVGNFAGGFYNTSVKTYQAIKELTENTGLAAEFSTKNLDTHVLLTKRIGLNAQEATNLWRVGKLYNSTTKEVEENLFKGLVDIRNSSKAGFDLSKALKDASNMSAILRSNLHNNPELIGQMVAQLKAFGMEQSDINSLSSSLLNFQSSLSAELEAELMTGKELRLEKARYAALTNDTLTLTKEIASQMGSIEEYSNLSYLSQQKLAGAFGISRERMAEILEMKKLSLETGKTLEQVSAEEAKNAMEKATAQQKFNEGMDKLKSFLGDLLSGPFMGLLQMVGKVLEKISIFAQQHPRIFNAMLGATIGGAVGGGWGALAGAGLGLIGGSGSYLEKEGEINDGIVQNGKIITTDPDDYLIATKSPENLSNNIQNNNIDGLKRELNDLKNIMKQILNKKTDIYMDGHKVGQVLDNTYNIA